MKLSDLKSIDQIITEDRSRDATFADDWDRTAFARQVAITIVRYRAENGLSQRQLAAATGLQQPAVARLELGEGTPSLPTLAKLSRATGLEFHLAIERGDVVLPNLRKPVDHSIYRVERQFIVRLHGGKKLTAPQLTSQKRQLTEELGKLERCNDDMSEPAVASDARAGTMTIKLTIVADADMHALQKALNICRTAIHAIGGSTPDWPKSSGVEPTTDFKPGGLQVEPV